MVDYVSTSAVILGVLSRFWPVWVALAVVLVLSFGLKKNLGLYGQLFDSGVGIAGVLICLFWLFTAIFASTIAPFDPLAQISVMKDALPGAIEPQSGQVFLFGRDLATVSPIELLELRKRMGMLFQNYALFDALSVEDNVGFTLTENSNVPRAEVTKLSHELIRILKLTDGRSLVTNIALIKNNARLAAGIAVALAK